MKKKILALTMVICMALIAVAGSTLAYFTDTKTVTNTFAIGKVKITLDEAFVNPQTGKVWKDQTEKDNYIGETDQTYTELVDVLADKANNYKNNKFTDDGKTSGKPRIIENSYPAMMPGLDYDKDPTIVVDSTSEDCYVFLDMTFNKYEAILWLMAIDENNNGSFKILENDAVKSDYADSVNHDNDDDTADVNKFNVMKYVQAALQNKDGNKSLLQAMIDKWFNGIDHSKWEVCDVFTDDTNKTMTIRFAYKPNIAGKDNKYVVYKDTDDVNKEVVFMTEFGMPETVEQSMIDAGKTIGYMDTTIQDEGEFTLNFTAYAIQANNIADDSGEKSPVESLKLAYKAMFNNEDPEILDLNYPTTGGGSN